MSFTCHGVWTLVFLHDMYRGTVAIYDLFMFMTLIPIIQLQYSGLSHHVSFIKIAGIIALCMSLNLIKCSSHLKENQQLQYNIILLLYVAVKVPFLFIRQNSDCMIFT